MSFQLVITLIFIALLAIGALKGAKRGLIRQSIRTGTIFLSIIICLLFVLGFVGAVDDILIGNTVEGVLTELNVSADELFADSEMSEEEMDIILGIDTTVARNLLLVVAAAFIFPFSFAFLFIIISGIFEVIYGVVCILLKLGKNDHSRNNRLIGAAIGFVQAFIVAVIIFLPIGNAFNIMDQTMDALRPMAETDTDIQQIVDEYDEYVDPLYCFPLKVTNAVGGKMIAKSVTSVKIDGEKYDSRHSVASIISVVSEYNEFMTSIEDEGEEKTSFTKEEQDELRSIIGKAFDDKLILSTSAGVLKEISKAYLDYMDNDKTAEYNAEQEFMSSLFQIFANSTTDTLESEINHCLDILFLVTDEGLIEALEKDDTEALKDVLTKKDESGRTLMKRLIDLLNSHPSTKTLVDTLTKLSVSVMMKGNDQAEQVVEEIYTEVKTGIGSINEIDSSLNDEEYTAEVSEVISSTLTENNITVGDDVIDYMSEYVTENYKGKEITDADVNDIIFTYYDAIVADSVAN